MVDRLSCDDLFAKNKIIPVVTLNDIEKAIPLANALIKGGISIMEVTLRTSTAFQIIERIAIEVPEITVGAGTVVTGKDYHNAIKYGAKFIVSPGLTQELIKAKDFYNIPFIPGTITPTEVLNALNSGLTHLKYFPAESYNGLDTLKHFASIFPNIKFCPTGGINIRNAKLYLSLPNVFAIGCSFIVAENLIANSNFEEITKLTNEITSIQ